MTAYSIRSKRIKNQFFSVNAWVLILAWALSLGWCALPCLIQLSHIDQAAVASAATGHCDSQETSQESRCCDEFDHAVSAFKHRVPDAPMRLAAAWLVLLVAALHCKPTRTAPLKSAPPFEIPPPPPFVLLWPQAPPR